MTKKDFSDLGTGNQDFKESIQQFVIDPHEKAEKNEDKVFSVQEKKEKQATQKSKSKSATAAKKKSAVTTKKQVENKPKISIVAKPTIDELPDDFKLHSVLVSESQLSILQEKVLMTKIRVDKKYSMKKALYEAFSLWLSQDIDNTLEGAEDDFKTYSALFSASQLEDVLDRVYMHKARKDRNYSLKRAFYQAVDLFLKESV